MHKVLEIGRKKVFFFIFYVKLYGGFKTIALEIFDILSLRGEVRDPSPWIILWQLWPL